MIAVTMTEGWGGEVRVMEPMHLNRKLMFMSSFKSVS